MDIQTKLRKSTIKDQEWIVDNLIYFGKAGSRLYGTDTEDSDYDYVGVTYAPFDYWVGIKRFEPFQSKIKINDQDIEVTIFDIRKFIELASKGNPNIIENLFVPEILIKLPIWEKYIINNISEFISKTDIYMKYGGYAISQIKKLSNETSEKPSRQKIINKYGFDTKFAAHTYRLIHQAKELLLTGNIKFPRPEADIILKIRNGEIYKTAAEAIISLNNELKLLDDARDKSKLRDKIDFNRINKIQVNIFKELFGIQTE